MAKEESQEIIYATVRKKRDRGQILVKLWSIRSTTDREHQSQLERSPRAKKSFHCSGWSSETWAGVGARYSARFSEQNPIQVNFNGKGKSFSNVLWPFNFKFSMQSTGEEKETTGFIYILGSAGSAMYIYI